jgi:hypothetical protein
MTQPEQELISALEGMCIAYERVLNHLSEGSDVAFTPSSEYKKAKSILIVARSLTHIQISEQEPVHQFTLRELHERDNAMRDAAARTATLATLDALMSDLEFLPSSTDSKNIVWIPMRDVQEKIDDRKLKLRLGILTSDKPKCTMNHHNDDGTLIEYIGGGKPCIGCPKRKECFEIFYAYRNSHRRQSTTAASQQQAPEQQAGEQQQQQQKE